MMGNQPNPPEQRSESVADFVHLSVAPIYRACAALEVARALTERGMPDAAMVAIEIAERMRCE